MPGFPEQVLPLAQRLLLPAQLYAVNEPPVAHTEPEKRIRPHSMSPEPLTTLATACLAAYMRLLMPSYELSAAGGAVQLTVPSSWPTYSDRFLSTEKSRVRTLSE